jgi:hypothetical protein
VGGPRADNYAAPLGRQIARFGIDKIYAIFSALMKKYVLFKKNSSQQVV